MKFATNVAFSPGSLVHTAHNSQNITTLGCCLSTKTRTEGVHLRALLHADLTLIALGEHANSMADLDESCSYKALRRRTTVPITVTLNLIACGHSPPAHRSTEEDQSLPCPWVWAHHEACNPCDLPCGLRPNTRPEEFAANKFPRTGGPSLRRKPSTSALLRALIRQVRGSLLYPFGSQYGLRKISHHIAVDSDTCIAPSLSNQQTGILEVLLSLFTRSHSDPGALNLSLLRLELKIGGVDGGLDSAVSG